jgi:6-phosphogluconolactonase
MKRLGATWTLPVAGALLLLLLVPTAATAQPPTSSDHGWYAAPPGEVFTMSNAAGGNVIVAFEIGLSGALIPVGNFSTGGTGTGSSLADSGALALTADHQFLLVVNAGDNTVSLFAVHTPGAWGPALTLMSRVGSGGVEPVSVTVYGSVVYVLNAGNSTTAGNIAGFRLAFWGALYPIAGSVQPLSTGIPTGPAQISFNPWGNVLVVTEKNTNLLDSYPVNVWGVAGAPVVTPSNGSTPYGFAFDPFGTLIVSDAAIGALSSYAVARSGDLRVISGSVPDGQAAPCWVAVSGTYAFTTNAHGSTISTYQIGWGGTLSLVDAVAATTGAADTDMAIAGSHGQYLLVLDAGVPEIQEFVIGTGGTLASNAAVSALPPAAEGLAAF